MGQRSRSNDDRHDTDSVVYELTIDNLGVRRYGLWRNYHYLCGNLSTTNTLTTSLITSTTTTTTTTTTGSLTFR